MSDQNVPSTGGGDTTPTRSNNPSDASTLLTPTPLRLNAKAQSFTPNLLGASPIRQSNNTSPAPAATTKGLQESTRVDTAATASIGDAPVTTGEKKHNPQLPSPMAPQLLGLAQGGGGNGGGMLPMMHPHPFTPHMPGFTPGSGGVPMVQPPMFVAPWFGQAPPPPPSPMFFMPPPPPSPFAFGPPPPSPFFSPPGSSVPSFHQFMVTMHQTHMKNMSEAASGNNVTGGDATTPPAKTQSGKKDATTVKKPLNPACGEYTPSQKPDAAASAIPPVVDYTSTVFVPGRGMVPTYLLGPGHQPLPEGDDDNGDSQEDDGVDDGEGILPSGVTPQLFDMYWKMWLQLQRTSTFAAPNGGVAAATPGHVSTTPVASTKSAAKAAAAANPGNTNAANGGMGTRGNSEVIGSPSISVGNATFQAYTSKDPPKFACVLVIGLPSSGKTTVSRQLVSELVEERFAWEFFSGSEHIPESNAHTRAPTWDTTKAVFDALSDKIDNLLESQKFSSKPVKGLLIDKNVKGIEDVYYLYALLKKKGVQLNGIINFDSHDDDKLARRVCKGNSGLVDSTKERFKFYRAILSRVMESTKGSNLWHSIDVNDDFPGVTKHLRSKVLGCSVMQNTKPLYICNYTERNASMVHNYVEYAQVMSRVCLHARTPKPNQFPGQVTFPPLTTAVMGDNSQIRTIRESFVARRKIDGTQYVLFHEEGSAKLYLIPRHMRAVLRIPAEGWMGVRLEATGTFLLDGELVPLQADHTKEKFLVHDVIFWAEKGETENNCKGAWKVRQDRLQSFMVNESLPFHGKRSDIVVAFQNFVPISQIARLLGPSEYASEGIILQSTLKKEHTFLWRSPEQLSVDFRLGTMHAEGTVTASGGPVEVASIIRDGFPSVEIILTFDLEVFCPKAGKYVSYDHFGGVDVTCLPKFHVPVPGSIATCYLVSNTDMEDRTKRNLVDRKWKFRQLRSDVPTSSFKPLVDSIVDDGYVPLSELAEWFKKNEIISPAAVKDIDEASAARKAHLSNAGRAAAANAAAAAATPPHVFSGSTDAVLMQHYWLNVMGGGGAVPPPGTMPPFAPALPPQQHAMQRQTSNSTFDGPMSRQGSTVMSTTPPPMPTAQNRAAPSMSDILRMKEAIQATPTTKASHADAVPIRQTKSKRTAEPAAANAVGSESKSREPKTREPKVARGEPRVSGGKQQEGKKAVAAAAPREPKKKAAAEGEVAVPPTKVVNPTAPSKPQPKKAAAEKKSVVKAASEATTTAASTISAATPDPKKKKEEGGGEKKSDDARKDDGSDDGNEDGDSPQSKAAEKRRGRRGGRKEREKRERREKRSGIDGEAPISATDESGAAPQQSPTPAVAMAAVATVAAE